MLTAFVLIVCCKALFPPVVHARGARIQSGLEVSIKNYPYHVALERENVNVCSGAIVARNKVVTAAHCLKDGMVSVRYGSDKMLEGGKVVNVSYVKEHPSYNSSALLNDVAVLVLEEDLVFSDTCAAISISPEGSPGDRTCWVSGWGSLNDTWRPVKLHAVNLREMTLSSCSQLWPMPLSPRMICFRGQGKNICMGDSGGPLVDKKAKTLVGLASFGPLPCDHPTLPSVYTNVGVLSPWLISQATKKPKINKM